VSCSTTPRPGRARVGRGPERSSQRHSLQSRRGRPTTRRTAGARPTPRRLSRSRRCRCRSRRKAPAERQSPKGDIEEAVNRDAALLLASDSPVALSSDLANPRRGVRRPLCSALQVPVHGSPRLTHGSSHSCDPTNANRGRRGSPSGSGLPVGRVTSTIERMGVPSRSTPMPSSRQNGDRLSRCTSSACRTADRAPGRPWPQAMLGIGDLCGRGGMRVEYVFLVTATGNEMLSRFEPAR
jgi:hypothetical protein